AAKTLKELLAEARARDPRRTGPAPTALVEIARALSADAPLLLIIDEFGKNLEAIHESSGADPYLLQQLAELGHSAESPMFGLTLQHMAFEDYLVDADETERREWAKIQGRFEDVAFVESPVQTRALIGSAFNVRTDVLDRRVRPWARRLAHEMTNLGILD